MDALLATLPPLSSVAFAMTAVFVGAVVQGSVGFGSALVAAPILALIAPRTVPGSLLAISLALASLMAIRERKALQFGRVGWALLGRVPGLAVGLAALALLPERSLGFLFVALVLAAVFMSALGASVPVTRRTLFGAGLIGGFMGTVASIGGPPIALLYQTESGRNLRGDLSAYFAVGTATSLMGVTAVGRFGVHQITWSLVLLPAVLLGFLVSFRTRGILDAGYTRPAVLALSAAASFALLGKLLLTAAT